MQPVSAKDLKERLKKSKTVVVAGNCFEIRCAPLLLLAEENEDLWTLARRDKEALSGRIKDLVANPTLPRMRRILLAGVVQPRLSDRDEEDAVCIDDVLAHHELSAGLFIEVVNFSLTSSLQAKEP